MWNDLTNEIVRRNVITLQLNRLFLENAQKDLRAADELVGHVRLSIRQSGYSVVHEDVIRELTVHSPCRRSRGIFFNTVLLVFKYYVLQIPGY